MVHLQGQMTPVCHHRVEEVRWGWAAITVGRDVLCALNEWPALHVGAYANAHAMCKREQFCGIETA